VTRELIKGLQKGDVEKWGEVFNLEFIEFIELEIRNEKIRLTGLRFGGLKPVYYVRSKLFSINRVVRIIFLAKNIVLPRKTFSKIR